MQRLFAAFAAVALTAGTVAMPAAASEKRTMQVAIGDLDLSSQAGAAELDARLERAARAVCAPDPRVLREMMRAGECRTEALAGARSRAGTLIAAARQNGTRVAAAY